MGEFTNVNSEECCSLLQGVFQEGDQEEQLFLATWEMAKSREKLGWVPGEKGFHLMNAFKAEAWGIADLQVV